mmetsp:Transcript_12824/g.27829  ORF Transcript_12824/g.27829 Transcript_12824/m.27829 type:complete len:207 (-) Transcript_12824:860-1480(-)
MECGCGAVVDERSRWCCGCWHCGCQHCGCKSWLCSCGRRHGRRSNCRNHWRSDGGKSCWWSCGSRHWRSHWRRYCGNHWSSYSSSSRHMMHRILQCTLDHGMGRHHVPIGFSPLAKWKIHNWCHGRRSGSRCSRWYCHCRYRHVCHRRWQHLRHPGRRHGHGRSCRFWYGRWYNRCWYGHSLLSHHIELWYRHCWYGHLRSRRRHC